MLTHKRESCEACYRHVSIRRALTEELFTDPVFRSMCFNRFKIYLLYFSVVCLFFLMDTNSRLYFQSVQFNGTGVVSGLLASPCCPVWYAGLYYSI